MPEAQGLGNDAALARRFLTFRIDESLYALPAEDVAEVIHVPPVARVPHSPKGLLGLANLRGSVLPVASLRGLLGLSESTESRSSRAIILDGAMPVALAVDAVNGLVSVENDQVETRQAELAAEPGERLKGAFQPRGSHNVAKILDMPVLLSAAFVQRPPTDRQMRSGIGLAGLDCNVEENDEQQMLVTFDVAGQEYAFGIDAVQEIVTTPDILTVVPRAEQLVLGLTGFRDTLLPLLSLRGLLGFAPPTGTDGREKVVVTVIGGALVGLVADRVRAIVAADTNLIEPTPSVLAARTGGEATIKAIYRGDGGRRLISILAPEQLFRKDVMQHISGERAPPHKTPGDQDQTEELRFLVFRLGADEFGLPIDAVDEIARVPEQITRVPKAPAFLEGVVNLRGEVIPVVDQRRRFDMPKLESRERQRLVVVRTDRYRAGLIVDSVAEVLRCSSAIIEPPPTLTHEMMRLLKGVLNLEKAQRMVLLLDPTELLTRAERGLLDSFEAGSEQANL